MAPPAASDYSVLLQNSFSVEDFEWNQNEWPTLGHRDFKEDIDLPVFSLAPVLGAVEDHEGSVSLAKGLVEAAEKWGFFQVQDHGIPLDLIKRTQETSLRFFELAEEQKQKGARANGLPLGFSASNPDYRKNLPWTEIIQLQQSPDKINGFAKRVWGDESVEFRFLFWSAHANSFVSKQWRS